MSKLTPPASTGSAPVPAYHARLRHLARASRRALWKGAFFAGLPLAGLLTFIVLIGSFLLGADVLLTVYVAFSWWSWYFDPVIVIYIAVWLVPVAACWLLAYRILRGCFRAKYNLAMSILHHTDVLAVIIDGQAIELLIERGFQQPSWRFRSQVSGKRKLEDQFKLSAAFLQEIYAIAKSGAVVDSWPAQRLPGYLNPPVMVGYCLGAVASSLALAYPYNFGLGILFGPPLVYLSRHLGLAYAEYLGSLAAICEYALSEPQESTSHPVGM